MEKYQEIERSIITTYRKTIWSPFVLAVKKYRLIDAGDKIAVCISGGKDSSIAAALCVKALGKDRVIGVLMPCGGQKDIGDSVEVCNLLGIEHFIINIGEMYRDLRNRVMLVTHSEGDEPFRHVVVTMKRYNRERRDYRRNNNAN